MWIQVLVIWSRIHRSLSPPSFVFYFIPFPHFHPFFAATDEKLLCPGFVVKWRFHRPRLLENLGIVSVLLGSGCSTVVECPLMIQRSCVRFLSGTGLFSFDGGIQQELLPLTFSCFPIIYHDFHNYHHIINSSQIGWDWPDEKMFKKRKSFWKLFLRLITFLFVF